MRRSSGGGFRISPAEFPHISWVDGEYVPRVARARLTLRKIINVMINNATIATHEIVMISTR